MNNFTGEADPSGGGGSSQMIFHTELPKLNELPLTREEFDSAISIAAGLAGVEFNDDTKIAAVNFFHSLDRFEDHYDPMKLKAYLRKAYSSQMTFDISQEIHHKRLNEQKKPDLSVVEAPKESTNP